MFIFKTELRCWRERQRQNCLFPEYATEVSNGVKKNGEDTWDTTNTLKFRATARDDGRRIRCVVEHRALRRTNTMEKTIDLSVYCELFIHFDISLDCPQSVLNSRNESNVINGC